MAPTPGNAPASDAPITVKEIKRRFLALNQARLQRTQDLLGGRQRILLDLLPLLFHANHPMLPGYVTMDTPAGVTGYLPSKKVIRLAQNQSRSFSYQRRAMRRFAIEALFLMGSTGSIAQSDHSDFDVWVCYRDGLDADELDALRAKCRAIEEFAAGLGLEVHFFLLNATAFREGKWGALDAEHSGSSQRYLLLDEFYRTSQLLAGAYPAWWLVPPEQEHRYEAYLDELRTRRFVRDGETIDLGGLAGIPAQEFFGASLWQLYKSLDSPHKSLLKLVLMEAYASESPDTVLLSSLFKQCVYQDQLDREDLDPYLLMYRKVEQYLSSRGESDRLDLYRRCFYFKINEHLGTGQHIEDSGWRRETMKRLVRDWGWDRARLLVLDAQSKWKIDRVREEHGVVVQELIRSYQFLSGFARSADESVSINQHDLNILGRKLHAAFEKKAGKIDIIHQGISNNLRESGVTLVQSPDNGGAHAWSLYRNHSGITPDNAETLLKRCRTLMEILVWSRVNGVIGDGTRILVETPADDVSALEIRQLLNAIDEILPDNALKEPALDDLDRPVRISTAGIFINVGEDPMSGWSRQGMLLASDRSDPLSYGAGRANLVSSVDVVMATTWQEVYAFRYRGDAALAEGFAALLRWVPRGQRAARPPVTAFCLSPNHGPSIARRVGAVADSVLDWHVRSDEDVPAHYLVAVGPGYWALEPGESGLAHRVLGSEEALAGYLAEPRGHFCRMAFEPESFSGSLLPEIYPHNRSRAIQVFYHLAGRIADLYVLDENGALFRQKMEIYSLSTLVNHFTRFFTRILDRRQYLAEGTIPGIHDIAIEFLSIERDAGGRVRITRRDTSQDVAVGNFFDIQVIGDRDGEQAPEFTIYCNAVEFSSLEHGRALFQKVAAHVLSMRASGQPYPVHITDLDLSRAILGERADRVQTVDFLAYKKHIEDKLNRAMQELSADRTGTDGV